MRLFSHDREPSTRQGQHDHSEYSHLDGNSAVVPPLNMETLLHHPNRDADNFASWGTASATNFQNGLLKCDWIYADQLPSTPVLQHPDSMPSTLSMASAFLPSNPAGQISSLATQIPFTIGNDQVDFDLWKPVFDDSAMTNLTGLSSISVTLDDANEYPLHPNFELCSPGQVVACRICADLIDNGCYSTYLLEPRSEDGSPVGYRPSLHNTNLLSLADNEKVAVKRPAISASKPTDAKVIMHSHLSNSRTLPRSCYPPPRAAATNLKSLTSVFKISRRAYANPSAGSITSFDCAYCDRQFRRRGHLQRHYSVHTREKPFKCQGCSKKFSRKDNMNQHRRQYCERRKVVDRK